VGAKTGPGTGGGAAVIQLIRLPRACVLPILAIFCVHSPLSIYYAQEPPHAIATALRGCLAQDLDINVQFKSGPGARFTAIFSLRNISSQPCVLNRGSYGANGSPVFPDRSVPGGKPLNILPETVSRLDGPQPDVPSPPLESGHSAYFTTQWKTEPPDQSVECVPAVAINWPVSVLAPSLLGRFCGDVEVSGFTLGDYPDPVGMKQGSTGDGQDHLLALTSERSAYLQTERFFLHVSALDPRATTLAGRSSCPRFYVRERWANGATLLRETSPVLWKDSWRPGHGILTTVPITESCNWGAGFDLIPYLPPNDGWQRNGQHTLQVFEFSKPASDGVVGMVRSNPLQLSFADAAAIPRKWGRQVGGLALGVTLDKETFVQGEDVPLHFAIENFDSEQAYGPVILSGPCLAHPDFVAIEVRDSNGRTLPADERSHRTTVYDQTDESSCYATNQRLAKSKIWPFEDTLGRAGWLPKRPGSYVIVATYTPCVQTINEHGVRIVRPGPKGHADVQASATFRIIESSSPPK